MIITGALNLKKETRFEKKQIESLVPCPIIHGIALIKKLKELNNVWKQTNNKFKNVQYDMKKTWKMINTAIGKKSTVRNSAIDHLTVDNQRVTYIGW